MSNTKTLNYFSGFGSKTNSLLGVGRYVLFLYERGKLPREMAQLKNWLREFLSAHEKMSRIYYLGTPLYDVGIQRASSWDDRDAALPVDVQWTSGVQLYSLSGSGRKLAWAELWLYFKIGRKVAQGFSQAQL